jgi:nitrite reductase/ring-hydroxylating ferredoxin subunit
MSARALLSDLPKIPVCTVRELLTVASCAHSKVNDDFPFRRVVQLPNRREIIVVMHARSLELFAMDRFCYHAGYPMDDGDIEDIPVREPVFSSLTAAAAPTSAAEAELARQSALVGRRSGSVDLATRDAQFKHMSKALLLAKGTQQAAPAAAAAEEPANAGGVAGATLSNEMLKLVRAGTLEADYDDPAKFHGDDSYAFPIITCKLHNRIFDLRTGDMITRAVEDVDDGSSGGGGVKGKGRKCVVSESTGCHQRIHPVTIERASTEGGEDGDGIIFVHDTFGYSIPMRRPGAPVNMATREHLMFLANKKIMSDRENLPREPKKAVADAAPAAVPTG